MRSKKGYSTKVDPDLLEISGSLEAYEKDMERFEETVRQEVQRLRSTKAGREKLRRAGLKP